MINKSYKTNRYVMHIKALFIGIISLIQLSVFAQETGIDRPANVDFNEAYVAEQQGDLQRSFELYMTAAKKGHSEAQFNVGTMYEQGAGIEKSILKAKEWYQKAGDSGFAKGFYNLGILANFPITGEADFKEAAQWYKKAADMGHAIAQNNLGALYNYGQGVEQSFETAVIWYTKAAYQGYDIAQYNLAMKYLNGQGVKQSELDAYTWLEVAAMNNSLRAKFKLHEITKSILLRNDLQLFRDGIRNATNINKTIQQKSQ